MPQAGTRSRSPRICFSHRFYCALAADSEVLLDGSDFYDCVFVCVWEVFTIGVREVYDISVIGDITQEITARYPGREIYAMISARNI